MENNQRTRALFRKTKLIILVCGAAVPGIVSVIAYFTGKTLWAILTLIICVILIGNVLWTGCSFIEIDDEEVRLVRFGKCSRRSKWSEIQEVMLVGICLFGETKKSPKMRYIYFSKDKLNEETRYELYCRWPPERQLYCQYREELLEQVETNWHGHITYYNFV